MADKTVDAVKSTFRCDALLGNWQVRALSVP